MSNSMELESLLNRVPIADLAEQFGVDERTAAAAVKQALPGLVGGMAANASDADGADNLARALQRHDAADERPTLQAIDTEDGQKIVNHVLGDKSDSVAQALGAQAGSSAISELIPKLLPILAPIVMQFLAGRVLGGGSGNNANSGGLGDVLGDLVGGLFGGDSSDSAQRGDAGGGGLGDLLGGLLGGGSGSSSGGLDDLLGGLLGGKK